MATLICTLRHTVHALVANVACYHTYLLTHLFVTRRYRDNAGKQKVEKEKERIRNVWMEIVANDLTGMSMSDFKQKEKCGDCDKATDQQQ